MVAVVGLPEGDLVISGVEVARVEGVAGLPADFEVEAVAPLERSADPPVGSTNEPPGVKFAELGGATGTDPDVHPTVNPLASSSAPNSPRAFQGL